MPGLGSRLRHIITSAIAIFCVVVSAAPFAHAESDIAIRGTIFDDSTGNPVEQATIRIEGTALSVASESDGSFEIRAVPLGIWSVTVERAGYHPRDLDGIDIVEGFTRSLHIALTPDPIALSPQSIESELLDSHGSRRITLSSEQIGARSIGEVLGSIPGVRVYGSSDSPGGTRVSVGGEPASRVAVMLDGLPLSGGSDGAVDLGSIPLSALTAIEVHSGSQSVMAGDAAVGGTVNLITRSDSHSSGARASTSGGDWARTRQEVTLMQAMNRMTVSAGGEYDQRHNPYKFIDVKTDTTGKRQNARLDERRAFLRIGNAGRRTLEVLGYASRNERGAPGTIERPMLTSFTRNKNGRVQSSREIALSTASQFVTAAWYEFSSEYYDASEEPIPQHSYLREHFVGAKSGYYTVFSSIDVTAELEARYRAIHGDDLQRPTMSFGNEERGEYSVRSRLSRHFKRISLHAGIALDADADNAPGWSPRLDVSIRPMGSVALGIGWGRSFRRPLLLTAFWKSDYYTQGNPDLLPERAREWDASIRWRHRFITVESRYFERTIEDIIVWDLRGVPQKYTPVNLASGEIIGREDHIGIAFANGAFSIDYTQVFNDGRDHSGQSNYEGETLPFMPRHTHELTVRASHGPVSLHATSRWVSLREALRSNTNRWQAPYEAYDADLRFTPSIENPHVAVFLRTDNITNEPIELLEGYPSPSRTFSAGITITIDQGE